MADKKNQKKGGPPSPTPIDKNKSNVAISIKPPGAKKEGEKVKEESAVAIASKAGRRQAPTDENAPRGGRKNKDNGGGGKKAKKEKKEKKKKRPKKKGGGCVNSILSKLGIGGEKVVLIDPRAIEAAQALDLRPHHLRKLRARFDQVDLDGSGAIDADEFFESVQEQRSPFTDKLFALIDLDGSGTIEFDEYVRVMATYCMFSKDEILRFCFECFDVDGSGTIDEKEFMELCKTVNNASPTFPGNFKTALENFDVNEDGLIDYHEFCEVDRRYPLVLFPAFRLQDTMQKNSLGENTWLSVIQSYQEQKIIEEYKATHGGKLPPDPPLKAIAKAIFPCFFRERVHVKLGADMEARHRAEGGKKGKKQ
jgi:Ca2+-binding EF-hand superfamily protein